MATQIKLDLLQDANAPIKWNLSEWPITMSKRKTETGRSQSESANVTFTSALQEIEIGIHVQTSTDGRSYERTCLSKRGTLYASRYRRSVKIPGNNNN